MLCHLIILFLHYSEQYVFISNSSTRKVGSFAHSLPLYQVAIIQEAQHQIVLYFMDMLTYLCWWFLKKSSITHSGNKALNASISNPVYFACRFYLHEVSTGWFVILIFFLFSYSLYLTFGPDASVPYIYFLDFIVPLILSFIPSYMTYHQAQCIVKFSQVYWS